MCSTTCSVTSHGHVVSYSSSFSLLVLPNNRVPLKRSTAKSGRGNTYQYCNAKQSLSCDKLVGHNNDTCTLCYQVFFVLRDGTLHVVEHMVAHVTRSTYHGGGLGTRLRRVTHAPLEGVSITDQDWNQSLCKLMYFHLLQFSPPHDLNCS